jgi:YgiT-type zinc finger domain-containing protein
MTNEARLLPVPCPRCGRAMRAATVKTAIWQDERLFVVEDIPARVCDSCVEQFYDDDVTDALRRLAEDQFPPAEVRREVLVPVFSLEGRIQRAPVTDEPRIVF